MKLFSRKDAKIAKAFNPLFALFAPWREKNASRLKGNPFGVSYNSRKLSISPYLLYLHILHCEWSEFNYYHWITPYSHFCTSGGRSRPWAPEKRSREVDSGRDLRSMPLEARAPSISMRWLPPGVTGP